MPEYLDASSYPPSDPEQLSEEEVAEELLEEEEGAEEEEDEEDEEEDGVVGKHFLLAFWKASPTVLLILLDPCVQTSFVSRLERLLFSCTL